MVTEPVDMYERYGLAYPTIEQTEAMLPRRLSRPGRGTTVEREGWFYLGTYFTGGRYDPNPQECTLLVRRVQQRRGPSGRLRTAIDTDALKFPNEAWMGAWIEEHDAEELPPEADGNPRFVPEGWES